MVRKLTAAVMSLLAAAGFTAGINVLVAAPPAANPPAAPAGKAPAAKAPAGNQPNAVPDDEIPVESDVAFGVENDVLLLGVNNIEVSLSEKAPDGRMRPLADVNVVLVSSASGERVADFKTDAKGGGALGAHPVGDYLLTLGRGFVQGRLRVAKDVNNQKVQLVVPESAVKGTTPVMLTRSGESADLTTYVTGPGRFRGQLVDVDGATALPDVPVRLLSRETGDTVVRKVSTENGTFDLGKIEPGEYSLFIGKATVTANVMLDPNLPPDPFLKVILEQQLTAPSNFGTLLFAQQSSTLVPQFLPAAPAAFPAGAAIAGGAAAAVATAVGVAVPVAVAGGGGGGGGAPPPPVPTPPQNPPIIPLPVSPF
jgi:hypothetical protein